MAERSNGAAAETARFDRISECGLCIGCGLCQSLAGPDRIRMRVTAEGTERPVVTGALDRETVDAIYDVCPGLRVEGLPEALIDAGTREDPVWGPYRRMVRAYAADPEVRFRAATGGVLSALALYLVESGRVDFVLHATASERQPTFGKRHLSFTAEQVMAGAGSRYGPTAALIDLAEVLDRGRPFAYCGKPCDIGALRNYARRDPRVDQLVRFWLTPVCGGFMPPPQMRAFLLSQGIAPSEVAQFHYRGLGCPGPTRITTRDGRVIDRNYLDLWGEDESAWSLPFRCKVCPDGIGEAADIAASDTWPGGSPGWEGQDEDPGTNGVIARTAAGAELLEAAEAAGYLTIERDIGPADMSDYQPHQVAKKRTVWARHAGLRAAGELAPETARLRIAELARENGFAANLAQARGTRQRVRAGKTREPTPKAPGEES